MEIFYRKTNKAPKLPIHTPLHLLRRYAIRLAEGVVEAGGVFEAAAEGYFVDAQFGVGFEQMACALHLYLQYERGWRTARERNNLTVELSRTHAQLFGERVHVELLLVHEQIDMVYRLGEESAFGIRQLWLLLLWLLGVGSVVAKLAAQRALAVGRRSTMERSSSTLNGFAR